MRSLVFEAHVGAICESVDRVLPRLRAKYGESLTQREVIDEIGMRNLFRESDNLSTGLSRGSLRGTVWLDIPSLYAAALEEKANPNYLGEGI